MVIKISFLFFLLFPNWLYSQSCDCTQKFLAVKQEVELNYAGFIDKVSQKSKKDFHQYSASYLLKAAKVEKRQYCVLLIREWLRYFDDEHLQVYENEQKYKASDSLGIDTASKNAERINISSNKLKELYQLDSLVEGVYISLNDSTYVIAVIEDKNEFRDYVGVIVSSRTPYWKPGQVKLELKNPIRKGGPFTAITYDRFHNYSLRWFSFGGLWMDGWAWTKVGATPPDPKTFRPTSRFSISRLSDSTTYIRISSFRLSYTALIDSMFHAYESHATPNLILDIRGNGGGGDNAYSSIIPFLYTDPIINIGVDIYATPDNIQRRKMLLERDEIPQDIRNGIMLSIRQMEQNIGSMVVKNKDDTTVLVPLRNPKRVAILVDNDCASSAEEFLLAAKQSTKVKLFGESTRGELDYSNVLEAKLKCKDIEFRYPTTRSRRLTIGKGIDNIGIQPDIKLNTKSDWILHAKLYLESRD